jgi:hypothetical protein
MKTNTDMATSHTDEAWINNVLEPIKAAAEAPLVVPLVHEPSEEYLTRCRQSALEAWSLHKLKAEVQKAPAEPVRLTQWLSQLVARAGIQWADAIAHFTPKPGAVLTSWPAPRLGAFLGALGLNPGEARVQLALDKLWASEADDGDPVAVAARRGANGHSHFPDFKAADEAITRECSTRPTAAQAEIRNWLEEVTASMTPPA